MLPLHWFLFTPCPLCGGPLADPAGGAGDDITVCGPCRDRLALPSGGLAGSEPIPWWGAGLYAGALRELLLQLRRRPRSATVQALAGGLRGGLRHAGLGHERALLVPVPSWKRRANPLPGLLCQALACHGGPQRCDLLQRSRPVLGQHHLGRALRLANQERAFRCVRPPAAGESRRRPLLIVDDILTSGATACSAAETLRQAGWRVQGLVCLARTPRGRAAASDLGSTCR